jgi:rfaE bifunctional protein nucleotidyltransferase chain/domain
VPGRALRAPFPVDRRSPGGAGTDTCGAGDRFAVAAAAGLLHGEHPVEAVRHATDAAASFVTSGGAATLNAEPPEPESRSTGRTGRERIERVRQSGGSVVATGGCFDLLHPGHVSLLRTARSLGDALAVCVNTDESIRRRKGARRPVVSLADRVALLSELACVDAVIPFAQDDPAELLDELRPDIWVKGSDYTDAFLPEADAVRRNGGKIVLVPTLPGHSTSGLIEQLTASPVAG